MASVNKAVKSVPLYTAEGGKARHISSMQELRRSVLACMLWEDSFYEDGESIADRIISLIKDMPKNKLDMVAALAIEARSKQNLRHVPLLIINALASVGYKVADTIYNTIQRPDEITELLAMYWKDGKRPIAKQIKKGLAKAFTKFSEYSLQKYNQDKAIKLRWEVEISASKDKKASWSRLIDERKLGGLATLRNLRNMQEANVEEGMISQAIRQADYSRVLPFRFIAADRYAPHYEPDIESAMLSKLQDMAKLPGKTILLVDVSGSMDEALSAKSDMLRADAAFGLGMILRELCEYLRIFTFSNSLVEIAPRHGFALRDAMRDSQGHGGTYLGGALEKIVPLPHDRLIVITDEQTADRIPTVAGKNYMLNVACEKNGVGYGDFVHIDGFSEACVDYIIESEKEEQ